MSDLTFSGDIDLSPALGSVDELASTAADRLDEALSSVADNFAQALSSAATDALSNLGEPALGISADVAPAEAEVASLVSNVDSEQATIAVDADTSQAEEAASSLGDTLDSAAASASSSSGAVKEFGDSAAFVAGSAALGRGEVGGLGEVVSGAGLASAGAVAGVAALGGSVFELASKGIEATAAEERFNAILGETAAQVQRVQVGTLTADLGKLGIEFGSTDAQVKNSASSLFQYARNSGASRTEAAQFTDQIVALSARAVSLNPNLGTLSDVADSLGVRLARGGRFAAAYGVSLTQGEIQTRAFANTHKTAAADLTIFEKSQAAAQLAVEKYGGTLGTVVAEGAKNAANQNKSLKAQLDQILETAGKPLVGGIFEAIRAALPDVLAIAVPLAEIGVDLLPAVASAASIAGPPLRVVAEVIKEVPGPVLTAAAGAVILNSVLSALALRLGLVAAEAPVAAAGIEEVAAAEGTAAAESTGFFGAISLGSVSAGQALLAAGVGVLAYTATIRILKDVTGQTFNDEAESKFEKLDKGVAGLANTAQDKLVPAFRDLVTQSIVTKTAINALGGIDGNKLAIGSQAVESLARFRQLAQDSYPTAALLDQKLKDSGVDTAAYDRVLAQLAPHQRDNAAATQAATNAVTLLTGSYSDQIGVLNQEEDALLGIYDKTFAAQRAAFSAADSVKAYADATKKAADAGGQDAAANEEQAKTLETAEENIVRSIQATGQKITTDNEAKGATEAHSLAVQGQIAQLQFLAGTLDPSSPLRQFLDGLIGQLQSQALNDPHNTSVNVTDNASGVLGHIKGIADSIPRDIAIEVRAAAAAGGDLSQLGGLPHVIGNNLDGSPIYGYASGGDYPAGRPFVAGENGPELIVPATAGTVLPNSVYRASTSGDGGGGASNRAGQGGATFQIDRVVMEQATPNPVRETIRAAKQLRDAAAMARMT